MRTGYVLPTTALLKLEATIVITSLFVLCMLSLIAGLIFFIADVNMSLSALKLEVGVKPLDKPEP
ncbi:MAG: hypothetical protein COW19_06595 [Zetaproteobacteria bacterium CG12_big_fil_rev_8_21_14_0_65_55_1124]|nr:MAG: hypothetical protein AUJ58_05265 [Zetaproteobacteria bacterium CG1_02_55_237]PIS20189.1 MAG: hypothetical protein COT53_02035 [Zetaproteobacteria bacterium CG08_land_8_20_14_0_20_55_17]PIW42689.1 MAG: hypothetical protein COW19_06595 [Zetaproteobacteria bacterium CG12_big_fil_rev_8_21_14_0_65_55_1124]PIY53703.1 MAG: hypothetical protein COZ01_02720 [Zetaproteobacteria bacterium CG_4_10_14_0_8_um_filter_55_43]PIZ38836.1 MAG: hypothetical protein COY36_05095 [Zetaproteobacteria bacterium 